MWQMTTQHAEAHVQLGKDASETLRDDHPRKQEMHTEIGTEGVRDSRASHGACERFGTLLRSRSILRVTDSFEKCCEARNVSKMRAVECTTSALEMEGERQERCTYTEC